MLITVQFFVELWDQLHGRAKDGDREVNLAGPMSFNELKQRTSNSIGSDSDAGSVFDVTISQFRHLQKRAEGLLIQAIKSAFPGTFRPYLTKSQWTTLDEDDSGGRFFPSDPCKNMLAK